MTSCSGAPIVAPTHVWLRDVRARQTTPRGGCRRSWLASSPLLLQTSVLRRRGSSPPPCSGRGARKGPSLLPRLRPDVFRIRFVTAPPSFFGSPLAPYPLRPIGRRGER